jgi:hypothetical protein
MSVFAGEYTYKNYSVTFWKTPKTLKALIWKPNSLTLVKKFFVRDDDFVKLKRRVIKYLDDKSRISSISK